MSRGKRGKGRENYSLSNRESYVSDGIVEDIRGPGALNSLQRAISNISNASTADRATLQTSFLGSITESPETKYVYRRNGIRRTTMFPDIVPRKDVQNSPDESPAFQTLSERILSLGDSQKLLTVNGQNGYDSYNVDGVQPRIPIAPPKDYSSSRKYVAADSRNYRTNGHHRVSQVDGNILEEITLKRTLENAFPSLPQSYLGAMRGIAQESFTVPDTMIPAEYFVYASSPLRHGIIGNEEDIRFVEETNTWEKIVFPSSNPDRRAELYLLAKTLDDMIEKLNNTSSSPHKYVFALIMFIQRKSGTLTRMTTK